MPGRPKWTQQLWTQAGQKERQQEPGLQGEQHRRVENTSREESSAQIVSLADWRGAERMHPRLDVSRAASPATDPASNIQITPPSP
jgi:hypothetical protein